ncbi:hypothetical protein OIE66_39435 [Nonomuraea sp. NBC_01738]|uniref:hypothetical protein n=1 Tax=Nonomuraea sp. NBC_01738 TaxID=2976003 RepID=UPI002E134E4B|nr:hypothetical protein OIE66_39435 [Nonomuraea sp. NBC_01738]
MEILPGIGVPLAKVGESREAVETRIGAPVHGRRRKKDVYGTKPGLIISWAQDDTVELVEVAYSGHGGEEVFLDGVQLTYRYMDDVVAELTAKGYTGQPFSVGFVFHAGFALWSMGSVSWDDDEDRDIVEGVGVAPFSYWE